MWCQVRRLTLTLSLARPCSGICIEFRYGESRGRNDRPNTLDALSDHSKLREGDEGLGLPNVGYATSLKWRVLLLELTCVLPRRLQRRWIARTRPGSFIAILERCSIRHRSGCRGWRRMRAAMYCELSV